MVLSWSCSQAVSKPVWHIPLLCVQWKTPDNGHRNCPKHVEFYSKNTFENSVHLVGFIIRICHDIRSPECQILIFYVFYMFRTRGFTFRWTVLYTGMVWYSVFYMRQYSQYRTHTLPTRLIILMHGKHTVLYLYIQPSSWRLTLGFETCRRHQKLKY